MVSIYASRGQDDFGLLPEQDANMRDAIRLLRAAQPLFKMPTTYFHFRVARFYDIDIGPTGELM